MIENKMKGIVMKVGICREFDPSPAPSNGFVDGYRLALQYQFIVLQGDLDGATGY